MGVVTPRVVDLAYPFTGRWLVQNSPANRVPSHGTIRHPLRDRFRAGGRGCEGEPDDPARRLPACTCDDLHRIRQADHGAAVGDGYRQLRRGRRSRQLPRVAFALVCHVSSTASCARLAGVGRLPRNGEYLTIG